MLWKPLSCASLEFLERYAPADCQSAIAEARPAKQANCCCVENMARCLRRAPLQATTAHNYHTDGHIRKVTYLRSCCGAEPRLGNQTRAPFFARYARFLQSNKLSALRPFCEFQAKLSRQDLGGGGKIQDARYVNLLSTWCWRRAASWDNSRSIPEACGRAARASGLRCDSVPRERDEWRFWGRVFLKMKN